MFYEQLIYSLDTDKTPSSSVSYPEFSCLLMALRVWLSRQSNYVLHSSFRIEYCFCFQTLDFDILKKLSRRHNGTDAERVHAVQLLKSEKVYSYRVFFFSRDVFFDSPLLNVVQQY